MSNLETILQEAFLDYSAFVIKRRAIPDARDMLKYTARQILHAQKRDKLDCKHPFKKSQKSVAAAISFSYVHGGSSAYEQIIRMGRPLVSRYFFEEINGNGGTPVNNGDYAAERYTEARLSQLTEELFKYIDMDTIDLCDWEPTYDEEGVFPTVLPSVGYYNICNGAFGSIAPTLMSSIPQFNLREVNTAIIKLIKNPLETISLLPDFASGGILLNPETTLASLAKGEGKSVLLRGKIKHFEKEKFLEIVELPYGVYTNTICNELSKALETKNAPFNDFKDLSTQSVRLRIYGKNLKELEQWVYENTSVHKHFTIKMIMLDNGKTPKLFNITDALLAHVNHAKKVFRKKYEYELLKLKLRQEILEGLIKAYSIINEVIQTIKGSSGRTDAIKLLIANYGFSQRQSEAIVDLKLHRLSTIDLRALEKELNENLLQQQDIESILQDINRFNTELIKVYEQVSLNYGDERRTQIYDGDKWEVAQDGANITIPFILTYEKNCYEALDIKEFSTNTEKSFSCINPEDEVFIVTNMWRGFSRKASQMKIGRDKWSQLIKLNAQEHVVFVTTREQLSKVDSVIICDSYDNKKELHTSFLLLRCTQRGKKIIDGKIKTQLQSIILQNA